MAIQNQARVLRCFKCFLTESAELRRVNLLSQARCILTNQSNSVQYFFTQSLTDEIIGEAGNERAFASGSSRALIVYPNRIVVRITEMKSVSLALGFCKTARCPSSQVLLAYRQRAGSITERVVIEKHLRECEFCNAELQLLERHRYYIERPAIAEMPSHLRRLAERLLTRPGSSARANNLIGQSRQFSQ